MTMTHSNGMLPKEQWLDSLMDEREVLIVRLGQLENILISERRLQSRTKQPRHKGRRPAKAW